MHYQADPYGEIKLVQVIKGAIYDVIIDVRPESGTYCRWKAIEFSADNRKILYIPIGVQWPIEIQVICLKNRNWQYFTP